MTPITSLPGILAGSGGSAVAEKEKGGKRQKSRHGNEQQKGVLFLLSSNNRVITLENEHVPAGGNGADEDRVKSLVVLLALGGSDVDDLPFQVIGQILDALERDFELNRVLKRRRIVKYSHVRYLNFRHLFHVPHTRANDAKRG